TESTITILVNEVNIIRIAGAKERTVNKRKISRTTDTCPGSTALSRPILKKGAKAGGVSPQQILGVNAIEATKHIEIMIYNLKCL
ncbi:MAG: hypothetical protein JRJ25_07075, partial [Deltaproteobacteria bacterium]|nr:hypothetical protein [Deltaproteobacteria bacterium]